MMMMTVTYMTKKNKTATLPTGQRSKSECEQNNSNMAQVRTNEQVRVRAEHNQTEQG